jgi:hypothetical protein
VGLDPVAVAGEGAEVAGAGLAGWSALLVGGDVVAVDAAGEGGGVGEVLAGGGEQHPFPDGLGDLVGVHGDPVGQVEDGVTSTRATPAVPRSAAWWRWR